MLLALVLYLLAGLVAALSWVDLWERRYLIRWVTPWSAAGPIVGGATVVVLVILCWPVYGWVRWRWRSRGGGVLGRGAPFGSILGHPGGSPREQAGEDFPESHLRRL